jgi:polysaccharide biosynthesis protein PslG
MQRRFWLLAFLLPLNGLTAEIPAPVIPAGVGVNIHFAKGHHPDLDLISAAGFHFVRMDFSWAGTEPSKGDYRWADYEELFNSVSRRDMRAIFILDYSNPLYESEVTSTNPLTHSLHRTIASPQHPASVAAYATWAAAAARHFHGRHLIWELWNEPNIDFWSPKPDAKQYTDMALAAAKAIRQADPTATIIGPASSGFPWPFLETFLKSGALEYLDGVSVHPYREPRRGPETAGADYQRLRDLIDQYAPSERRGKIPIISGEWGYSSWQHGVSLETQAAFAVRQQLFNLFSGIPLSIWYDWKNDGTDFKENEHNFGTVLPDLKPKPAYLAIQTMTHQLEDYRIVRRLTMPNVDDFVLVCRNLEAREKLVAWTAAEPHQITLELTGDLSSVAGVLGNGNIFKPSFNSNQCTFELTSAPCFLSLDRAKTKQ